MFDYIKDGKIKLSPYVTNGGLHLRINKQQHKKKILDL
jgi:hypothetical protein